MVSEPPVLLTDRLRLRVQRPEDFETSHRLWSDPSVVRHIGGRPSSPAESWARLLRNIGHWTALGFGYWRVERSDTGEFVGEVGLADFRRDLSPSLDGLPEAGWVLSPHAHGAGFATEAVAAALRWADDHLPASRTACIIAPDNAPSRRVAAKCGFEPWTKTRVGDDDLLLFRRDRCPVPTLP